MAGRAWTIALAVPPLAALVLWLISGRETLSKSAKVVDVTVRDELFGTIDVQKQFVRGPILGYYVGLDVVIAVAIACLAAWVISQWVMRRRRRHPGGRA